ncbi:MAG: branched-chain amino acid ABC transporter permease [candidate division WOR-3 bacterium]
MLLQFIANGLVEGVVLGMFALGFSIIYNSSRVFNFAQGGIFTVAGYIVYLSWKILNLPIGVGIMLAIIGAIGLGMLLERLIFYPLYRQQSSPAIVILSSLGSYLVIVNLIVLILGNETRVLRSGVEETLKLGGGILTKIQVFGGCTALILSVLTIILLRHTRFGITLRALADNSSLIAVLGLGIQRLRLLSFAWGSMLGGVAGVIAAFDVGIDPHVGGSAVLIGAVATILGGIRVIEAAFFGGVIIGITKNLAAGHISARWESAVTFFILLIVLLLRPQGILGKRGRLEEI